MNIFKLSLIAFCFLSSIASAHETVSSNEVETVNIDSNLIYSLKSSWRTENQQPLTSRLKRHKPRTILIHHTGTPQSKKTIQAKLQGLYRFSTKDKNWGDVPYHFYIDKDGNMMGGRPVEFQPDTNTEFDPNGYLNITVEGNYTKKGGDHMNESQTATLRRLIADLKKKYGLRSVMKHNDIAQTECPGNIHF